MIYFLNIKNNHVILACSARVLHREATILLFWGAPLVLLAPPHHRVHPCGLPSESHCCFYGHRKRDSSPPPPMSLDLIYSSRSQERGGQLQQGRFFTLMHQNALKYKTLKLYNHFNFACHLFTEVCE